MNLNQVTIPVTDVERSIAFYEKLGNRLIVKSLPGYARFECPEGEATFSLHKIDAIGSGSQVIIYFEVKDLDIVVQQLIDKGVAIDELPEDKNWLWREAKLNDPDGNKLILYYAGSNRKDPPWRIKT